MGTHPLFERLVHCPLLEGLDDGAKARLVGHLETERHPRGATIFTEGDPAAAAYFVVVGAVRLLRRQVELRVMNPGDSFGEAGLAGRPRHATAVAITDVVLARLDRARFRELAVREPLLAREFLEAVVGELGTELGGIADRIGQALRERSLPRRTQVRLRVDGVEHWVNTGKPLRELLPADRDGRPVVAALLDNKAVSLSSAVTADADVGLLTTAHWEGQEIYRRSVALLLLEAARQEFPRMSVRMGPTMGSGDRVELGGEVPPFPEVIDRVLGRMRELVRSDSPFRTELWTVEEAISHFAEEGWGDAALLLRAWRDATVPLVSCGELYALAQGPFLASAGQIRGFGLHARSDGLRLTYGDEVPIRGGATIGAGGGGVALRSPMAKEHDRWLAAMGVKSVGAFNDLCVSGKVANLIRVAEGFHEKEIGQIADRIRDRADRVRVITIAGPSSSGKTTFIKRLTTQLLIDGLNPVSLSLDDYYVDREKTVRDENGEYDFEALEAIDLPLLHDHLRRLTAGETVTTARFDFVQGKSFPAGGPRIALRPGDVLMLEGIHGLNPKLVADSVAPEEIFRIFLQPMTTLPFDRLSRMSAADLRLVRRIVRDRHSRGHNAAATILRWPSVRNGERKHIFPFEGQADAVFDTSLVYEPSVLKVYAERYLLEVPQDHPAYVTAYRLRRLLDRFVTIYPDHVPPTSILREYIGGSGFEY